MSPRVVVVARWWFGEKADPTRCQRAFVIDDALTETWAEQIRRIGDQVPIDVHWDTIPVPAGIDATRVLAEVGA